MVLVTSGPGLNIMTGLSCCWVDGIPLLLLAGQVLSAQKLENLVVKPRQRGVQESPTHQSVLSNTKYSVSLTHDCDFLYELDNSYQIAIKPRMGPVVIEIPVEISYKQIYMNANQPILSGFEQQLEPTLNLKYISESICQQIDNAKSPYIVLGNGIRNLPQDQLFRFLQILEELNISYSSTWASKDLIESFHSLDYYFGSPGNLGCREKN